MPDDELLSVQAVRLVRPAHEVISRPGLRVTCSLCGEEVMNARELVCSGRALCRACAVGGYYRPAAEKCQAV
jgi:formylmethanofuran dehydrogenase subunit E